METKAHPSAAATTALPAKETTQNGAKAPRARPEKAAYQRGRRQRIVDLAFDSVDQLHDFRAIAEAEGYEHNFNAWIILKLLAATSGQVYPPGYVEGLREDLTRARQALERARDDYAEEREERKKAQQQLAKAVLLIQRLPGGEAHEAAEELLREVVA